MPLGQKFDTLKFAWRFFWLPKAAVADCNSQIMRALSETLWNVASPREIARASTIEQHRSALAQNQREVEFLDFGAGARAEGYPSQDIDAGVGSTRRISEITLASKSPFWGRLLYKIVRLTGARNCVEMGTSLAISASYIASALPRDGKLITMEGAPAVADIAADTLRTLVPDREVEICVGPFQDTLGEVLEKMAPIDFVFIDGHHEQAATEGYCRQLLPHMQRRGVMVFDDIRWSPQMLLAWKNISNSIAGTCLDLGSVGIVLLA